MREDIKERKKRSKQISSVFGDERFAQEVIQIVSHGKKALDQMTMEMSRMLAESIFLLERESLSGPDYSPSGNLYKWSPQGGSIYIYGRPKDQSQWTSIKEPRKRNTSSKL